MTQSDMTPPEDKNLSPNQPQPVAPQQNSQRSGSQPASSAETLDAQQLDAQQQEEQTQDGDKMALLDRFTLLFALPSFLISLIVHVILTAVAALIVFVAPQVLPVSLEASNSENVSIEDEINLDDLEMADTDIQQTDISQSMENMLDIPTDIPMDIPNPMDSQLMTTMPSIMPSLADISASAMSTGATDSFSGRSGPTREAMLKNNGGTAASEAAVELGLKWLAAHQLGDGGWDLNHQNGPGRFRQSPNPGKANGRFGATGLALLPFLGKGYTHQEGNYQKTVRDGLAFLIRNIRIEGANGGSYMDETGNMYSHAIATICLCEAYGMTKDKKLLPPAMAALKFIVYAQDPIGGGWRYGPQMPGDTSAVGWQLMALKSGSMMGQDAPPVVFQRTKRFLDYVQSDGGTRYGYDRPAQFPGRGTTSVGVLSRMYLGWNKDNPTLVEAVEKLSALGPDTREVEEGKPKGGDAEANMYYNYYATQIMRHYGDEPWEKWNDKMRDFLVESQSREGVAEGSWFFANGHSSEIGGRLYTTAMAVMTLEVYYRHLPLYRGETLEDDFPLD